MSTAKTKSVRGKKSNDGLKRPLNNYMLFMKDVRPTVVQEHPEMKTSEIGKEIGVRWRALSPQEKQPYTDKAKKLLDAYKRAKAKLDSEKA